MSHRHLVASLLCLAFVRVAIAQSGRANGARPPTERQTAFGPVVGIDNSATSGTYAWKGVPFAKPPIGDLRWKPPSDPAPWTSPRSTQQFGNACVQLGRLYGPGSNNRSEEHTSELQSQFHLVCRL